VSEPAPFARPLLHDEVDLPLECARALGLSVVATCRMLGVEATFEGEDGQAAPRQAGAGRQAHCDRGARARPGKEQAALFGLAIGDPIRGLSTHVIVALRS
jgi:hypothetical protein